jgi:hypothetical protein
VRAEVCFGQRAGAAHFTRMCLPKAPLVRVRVRVRVRVTVRVTVRVKS